MKRIFSLIVLTLTCNLVLAQDINTFDENGKRHGSWKKNFDGTNITRYEGQFYHGKEIGLFKFYKNYKNKAILTATKLFNENDNISEVKFLASNGRIISEGKMNGKIYIGTWKYYQKNSDQLLTVEYYNDEGLLNGERFVYYPNGQVAEKKSYINGKLNGVSMWYSVKGVVLKSFIYENDELHGEAKFYNPKGELVTQGQYKRGKKDGVWENFENGKIVTEKDFSYKPKYIKKTP